MRLDDIDRRLLNLLQASFPLAETPFLALAQQLGMSEAATLERVGRLKQNGILRQIGAIFDTRALGYQSTLVAMSLPPKRLDAAAAIVSQHPGVSHNYARRHRYNLWFTLALPPGEDLAGCIEALGREVAAESVLHLPALRVFKIGVHLDMVAADGSSLGGDGHRAQPLPQETVRLSPFQVAAVRELQEDLDLKPRAFAAMAQRLGVTEAEVLAVARGFTEDGIMRRYGAVLRHRAAGFHANAMTCWVAPPPRIEEAGEALASLPEVTHCYQRPTYPDWPYSLLAMIHAPSRAACAAMARQMASKVGVDAYALLYSTKEYKKERVRYFV